MKHYVKDQVVFITGGSSGFGLEAARLLLEMGSKLVITGRDQAKLNAAAAELGGGKNLLAIAADVTRTEDWRKAIDAAMARFDRLDILINNAGAGVQIAPVEVMEDQTIRQVLDTNLTGVILGCREAIRVMKPRKAGLIVNVTSACCYRSWASFGIYTAAKSGLVGFTKCLCKEMLEWGGRASLFIPGAARTNFCAAAGLADDWQAGYPDGADFARSLVHMVDVPPNCVVEELSIWGNEQVKNMLNPY